MLAVVHPSPGCTVTGDLVKSIRALVLLLVALLLPIRGAVAATMVCPEMGGTGQRLAATAHAHQTLHLGGADAVVDHHHGDAQARAGHQTHGAPDPAATDAPDGAVSDTCHICASGCGVAALLTAFPSPWVATLVARALFPSVSLPALDFQLDGQDRPPRTL